MPDGPHPDLRAALAEIAADLSFARDPDARRLFVRLDAEAWEAAGHNPTGVLAGLGDETLAAAAADPAFAADVDSVRAALAERRAGPGWWRETHGDADGLLVAYFSLEFGLDESLPIYSGGLGVLAGDHLKAADDLGLPLVGVGLLYRRGYFRQGVDENGWQLERYPENDPERLPLELERGPGGEPLTVAVELAGDRVTARIWRADLGRVTLYLLDTDLDENSETGRAVTSTLYGGDREQRVRQEMLIGVGGVQALAVLGLRPTVFHMNEGHSAFLALERVRGLVAGGAGFDDALEQVRRSTVFTTHTPVPAGNEVFDAELVRRYLGGLVEECGVPWERIAGLGRVDGEHAFGLTPLALRASAYANGVSSLHGEVAREMWSALWPDLPADESPIGHVTNGVHVPTWLSPELAHALRRRSVRPEAPPREQGWEHAHELDPRELWELHCLRKRLLLDVARDRFARQGGDASTLALDPEALTIGFARRFATYKRAGLLLSDRERLARLLSDPERPLQVLVAGKAHPADEPGKALIQELVRFSRDPLAHGRVVFLQDYEMELARNLVQGADVWLNTPRRPQEASGTSGMKAGVNGVPNLSILDGWWAEGFDPEIGFAVGGDATEATDAAQDEADAESLFRVLEQEVLPAFWERDGDGVPQRWVTLMKSSIARVGERFNAHRMLVEYVDAYYLPAHRGDARAPAAAGV